MYGLNGHHRLYQFVTNMTQLAAGYNTTFDGEKAAMHCE